MLIPFSISQYFCRKRFGEQQQVVRGAAAAGGAGSKSSRWCGEQEQQVVRGAIAAGGAGSGNFKLGLQYNYSGSHAKYPLSSRKALNHDR